MGLWKPSSVAKRGAICLALAVALLAGGCGFRTLRKNIERIAEQAVLEGHARVRGAEGNPIVIVVYKPPLKISRCYPHSFFEHYYCSQQLTDFSKGCKFEFVIDENILRVLCLFLRCSILYAVSLK